MSDAHPASGPASTPRLHSHNHTLAQIFADAIVVSGLASARSEVRRLREEAHGDSSTPLIVCIHPGTYFLHEQLRLDQPSDSNAIWRAVGDQPVVR